MTDLKHFTVMVVYVIYPGSSSQCNNIFSDFQAKLAGYSKHLFSQTKSSAFCVRVMRFALFFSLPAGGSCFVHPYLALCLCRKCKAYKEAWSTHVCMCRCVSMCFLGEPYLDTVLQYYVILILSYNIVYFNFINLNSLFTILFTS